MAEFFYVSDDEFREDFADAMDLAGTGGGRLSPANQRKADKHHREAAAVVQAFLRACLFARGLPEALLKSWSRGRDFERNIGLYFAYTRGSLGEGYDQAAIERMRTDWLAPFVDEPPSTERCWMLTEFCPLPTEPVAGGGVGYGRILGPEPVAVSSCACGGLSCSCGQRRLWSGGW
jgi:hypothetical protein